MTNWDKFDVDAELKRVDEYSYKDYHAKNKTKKNDELAQLYNEKGKIYFKKQDYENAMKQYQLVVDNASDKVLIKNAQNNLGFCCMKMDKYLDAIPYFQNVIDIELNLKAHFRMATCYKNLSRISDAVALLENVKGKDVEIDRLLKALQNSNDSGPAWERLPVEFVDDVPSEIDEAVDLNHVQQPDTVTKGTIIEPKSIPKFKPLDINASDLPLAKSLASLESNLSTLKKDQKIEYLMRYRIDQYKHLFKHGIEAHHIELLIDGIKTKENPLSYWNELKNLNRFNMIYMLVSQEHQEIVHLFK